MKKLIRTVQKSFPARQPSQSIEELGLSKMFCRNWGDYGAMALLEDEPGAHYITIGRHREPFMDSLMACKRNARIPRKTGLNTNQNYTGLADFGDFFRVALDVGG